MRVVHVAQSIAGGIGAYFEEISAFQSNEFGPENIFFIVPKGSELYIPKIDPAQLITFPGGRRSLFGLLIFGLAATKAIKRLEPAIVHLHSSFAGGVLRPFLMINRRRPRIVYCPHGWSFGMETSNLKRFVYAELERVLAGCTDTVIVNSDAERRLGAHYGIPPRKMKAVKNGICASVTYREEPIGEKTGPINVAFVGRHDRQKGLDILLAALEEVSCEHLHLHVVGKMILDKEHTLRARQNVTFHGWLSRPEIFTLLHQIDAVAMPSRWEAFGLVAIEAMRCGIPVIASNRGALPEIIRNGIDGYIFDIDEPGALSRLLGTLDRVELRRMGKSARERFQAEFTSDRMNVLIQRVYDDVLDAAVVRIMPPIAGRPLASPRTPSGGLGT